MSEMSTTFGGWWDRITYLLAEAQLLFIGIALSIGAALVIFRPSLPGVPPIVVGWFAVVLLFGPALFAFFVVLIQHLRQRRMVTVHHVDGRNDIVEKWYVSPEVWEEKTVDGPSPYPINGGSAWGVQEFEYLDDVGDLRVRGVYLSECQDTKLWTVKSHMNSVYEKLTQSHITLSIMKDSVEELGSDIQKRIINKTVEARERGTMLDKSAVTDVFEDFKQDIEGMGPDDLPTVDIEDVAEDAIPDDPSSSMGVGNSNNAEAPADD